MFRESFEGHRIYKTIEMVEKYRMREDLREVQRGHYGNEV